MTIRWAGGEDSTFVPLRAAEFVETSATFFNNARARCAMRASGNAGPDYQFDITGTPLTKVFLHFELYHNLQSPDFGSTDSNLVEFYEGAQRVCAIGATNNLVRFTRDNDGGGTTDIWTGGTALVRNVLHKIDLQLDLTASPETMQYFVAGSSISGVQEGGFNDVAASGIDRMVFRSSYNGGSPRWHYFSQGMVDDAEDLRDWECQTRIPNRDGEYGSWTGSLSPSFDALTEVVMDNTFLTSDAVDQLSSFGIQALPGDIGDLIPRAVVNTVSARKGDTGPAQLQLGLRVTDDSPGSDHFSADLALDTSLGPVYQIDSINPHTGLTWTVAEVDALESIMKSRT